MIDTLLNALSLPSIGLPALFIGCLASATLLPFSSEVIVYEYLKINPSHVGLTIIVATLGNVAGGMINYSLAYHAKHIFKNNIKAKKTLPKAPSRYETIALRWLNRFGNSLLLFSFLPIIGDPLTAMAGWLQLPWLPCLLWQTLGKSLRYSLILLI